MAPLIFFSATLTHLCGGSAGREGAALQIGGSVGARLGRALHLREKDLHVITMCGMSALFSALFGTPVTAALFCMEVISVGVVYYVALLPCLAAAITAQYVATFFGVEAIAFSISAVSIFSFSALPRVIVLAIACALVSILFIVCIHRAEWLYHRFLPNSYLRAAVGGLLLIGLTLSGRSTRTTTAPAWKSSAGPSPARQPPLAFLLKILFTALTIGAGFKGGEIIPTFFIGSTLGCALGGLLGLDPGLCRSARAGGRVLRRGQLSSGLVCCSPLSCLVQTPCPCLRWCAPSAICSPVITASTPDRRSSIPSSAPSTSTRIPIKKNRCTDVQRFFCYPLIRARILTQRQRQQFCCPFQILLVDNICHPDFLQAHTRRGVKPVARRKHDRLIVIGKLRQKPSLELLHIVHRQLGHHIERALRLGADHTRDLS